MLTDLLLIFNIVLPVFLLVVVGLGLKMTKIINDEFVAITSSFVYKVCLPVLIFLKLFKVDLLKAIDPEMITLIVMGILITFLISLAIAKYFKFSPGDEGVFVQGAFRSNYAIIGLAIIMRMFGPEALAKASFLLLFALPLYNLLGVISLTLPFASPEKLKLKNIIGEIALNPLILAVIITFPFSIFKIGIPTSLEITGNYIADIALPLALISIGGSINIQSLKEASGKAFGSAVIKNILSPVLVTFAALLIGIRGEDLGVLFIVFACPTAIASFIMAAGLRGNLKLAGNIIIVSTLGAILTMTAGLFLLKLFDLI